MSTSETDKFDVCDCPCKNGKIIKLVTTQDNPWSGADIRWEIECNKCSSEWSISGRTLTLKSSYLPYTQAYHQKTALSKEIKILASKVFQREFEKQKLRTKKNELTYFTDNKLTTKNYRQYLAHLKNGAPPWTACHWELNIDWLLEKCVPHEKASLITLLNKYRKAENDTQLALEKIINRLID